MVICTLIYISFTEGFKSIRAVELLLVFNELVDTSFHESMQGYTLGGCFLLQRNVKIVSIHNIFGNIDEIEHSGRGLFLEI
jgi:hypothetical protein